MENFSQMSIIYTLVTTIISFLVLSYLISIISDKNSEEIHPDAKSAWIILSIILGFFMLIFGFQTFVNFSDMGRDILKINSSMKSDPQFSAMIEKVLKSELKSEEEK